MPIYWGAIGGATSLPLFLFGMGLYLLAAGTWNYMADFGCTPPTYTAICQNCNDSAGVQAAISGYNSGVCQAETGGGPPPF